MFLRTEYPAEYTSENEDDCEPVKVKAEVICTDGTLRINEALPQLNNLCLCDNSAILGIPWMQVGQEIRTKTLTFDRQIDPEVDWANGDYELRDFYKKMFEIRSNCNVLKYCSVSNAWKSGGNIYAYMGEYEGGKYCSDELLG